MGSGYAASPYTQLTILGETSMGTSEKGSEKGIEQKKDAGDAKYSSAYTGEDHDLLQDKDKQHEKKRQKGETPSSRIVLQEIGELKINFDEVDQDHDKQVTSQELEDYEKVHQDMPQAEKDVLDHLKEDGKTFTYSEDGSYVETDEKGNKRTLD